MPLLCRIRHKWRPIDRYPMADTVTVVEKHCVRCDTWRREVKWSDGRKEVRDIQIRAWGVSLEELEKEK